MNCVETLESSSISTKEEIERRLKKAEEEVKHYDNYDYVIINDDFHEAVKELEAIILAEECLPRRIRMVHGIETEGETELSGEENE